MASENKKPELPEDEEGLDGETVEMSTVDLQKLAEEVFRLLKNEVQIENERQGR